MIKQTGLFSMSAANRQNERTIDKPSNGRACKVLYPEGLYRSIKKAARINKPMFITENGAATNNAPLRTEYIQKHLYVLSKALAQGFDIRGYLFWSLTDTFCWRKGYTNKHGIYAVDFKTQERTFRPSAQAYVDTVKRFRYRV